MTDKRKEIVANLLKTILLTLLIKVVKTYIFFNVGLPSSVPVERLFSSVGEILIYV